MTGFKYAMVQAGGSTGERYVHGFSTLEECKRYKKSCAEAAYQVSEPVPVPPRLNALQLGALLEAVAKASAALN